MNLLDYANLANESYEAVPTIGVEKSAARAVVSTVEGLSLIGFPGTNNGACVATDLNAITYDAGSLGHVHHGTYISLQSMWLEIMKSNYDVIYGHSLGGMLALLCGASLCVAGKPPKAIYAFEPAKISVDTKIRDILIANNVKTIITHNGNDLIPMLPDIFCEEWQHPAEKLMFKKAFLPFPNIEDHLMGSVIESIKEYLTSQGGT